MLEERGGLRSVPPTVRKRLALPPSVTLQPGERIPSPPGLSALGSALAATPAARLRGMEAALTDVPIVGLPGVRIRRTDLDPAILFVETRAKGVRVAGSSVPRGAGAWVLDGRRQAAWLRLGLDVGSFVIGSERGTLQVFTESLPRKGPGSPTNPAFLADLLAGERLQPWLSRELGRLPVAGGILDSATLAAVVARHWLPESPGAALERVERGSSPAHRAAAWMALLAEKERASIERRCVTTARKLEASAERASLDGAHGSRLAEAAIQWLHQRDALEGVALLLEGAGAGYRLRVALADLDAEASHHLTAWSRLRVGGDEWLRAVAWRFPDCWWGLLVQAE
jgi:hypothetical protein